MSLKSVNLFGSLLWFMMVLLVAPFAGYGTGVQLLDQDVLPPEDNEYTVAVGDIVKTVVVSGELQAARYREISVPRIRSAFGSSIAFLADEGAAVKQGDRILEFDSSNLLNQKSEAERKLDEAKLKISKTRADLRAQLSDLQNEVAQAEGNLEIAELYGKIPKELLPANDYQRYQVDLDQAKLALEKAKERLANLEESMPAQMELVEIEKSQAELDLRKIEGDLAMLMIDAPQDGIVIYGDNWRENRKVQVGDSVFPGMTALTLPDLSSMQVIGYIYDTELRYLRRGMPCSFGLDAVPGRVWGGKIASLTSVAGRKGFASDHKVFKAVIEPDGQDSTVMRPGMTARIEVPIYMATDVLAIPREYLGQDAQKRFFVLKGGERDADNPAIQFVEVGAHGESLVEILSGVNSGDKLIPIRKAPEVSQ
jgi:multidrug efflux pump subunit AcrA (membrane-fusion protein)